MMAPLRNDILNNDDDNNKDDNIEEEKDLSSFEEITRLQQLYWTTWKNLLIIKRQHPFLVFVLLFGTVFSVILTWLIFIRTHDQREADDDILFLPDIEGAIDECGVVNSTFVEDYISSMNLSYKYDGYGYRPQYKLNDDVVYTLNDAWAFSTPVILLSLGSSFNAVMAFVLVHKEMTSNLLGTLRNLGLRESVYWLSWFFAFGAVAFVNSLLGAITCKLIETHIFQSVYFGGIFASFFLLQLALISASFFLAAICGTSNNFITNSIIVLTILFIPWIFIDSYYFLVWSYEDTRATWSATINETIVWVNETSIPINETSVWDYESFETIVCDIPIISEAGAQFSKTEAERAAMLDEDIFVGCYRESKYISLWGDSGFIKLLSFMTPYFHFDSIWGNFVGYTSTPNRTFTGEEAEWAIEDLANQSFLFRPSPESRSPSNDSSIFPQFSFLDVYNIEYSYDYREYDNSVCPLPNRTGYDFCPANEVVDYNNRYPGYECKAALQIKGLPSTKDMYGFLVALAVIYFVLAWYWAQVFPFSNGRGERFYFFFQKRYWFSEKAALDTYGVSIKGIQKDYGKSTVLDNVTLELKPGEVTALLGHNGAGKTTISSIMSCEIPATSGDISIFGHSVDKNPYIVRQMLGLCKQDDCLWTQLTAKEHLQLYAGLRGVSWCELDDTVEASLKSVNLDNKVLQSQYPWQYSGGMRRRLSLALATIGDCPLVILDEPTTGMDPVSRRSAWRHIDRIRSGRVILLTTHAMDEADVLADNVAIVRQGKLVATGPQLHLKADYGTALQFLLLVERVDVESRMSLIGQFFGRYIDFVTVEVSTAGNIDVRILRVQNIGKGEDDEEEGITVELLSEFVSWLDSTESKVVEYSISNSSMEEVFLNVTNQEFSDDREHNDRNGASNGADIETNALSTNPAGVSLFHPNLNTRNQIFTLYFDFCRRGWAPGRRTRANWCFVGVMTIGSFCCGFFDNGPVFAFVAAGVILLIRLVVIWPVYSSRTEGQFGLMQSQGLLPEAYTFSVALYSLTVTTIFAILVSSALYVGYLCQSIAGYCEVYGYCSYEKVARIEPYTSPGGYGLFFVVALVYGISSIGGALSTAFLPATRFTATLVILLMLVAGALPFLGHMSGYLFGIEWIFYESESFSGYECVSRLGLGDCLGPVRSEVSLDCIGMDAHINYFYIYCIPSAYAIIPPFGLAQGLLLASTSKTTFVSGPPSYIEASGSCRKDSCVFPTVNRLFWLNITYMILGAILLIPIGYLVARFFVFPKGFFLRARLRIENIKRMLCCRKSFKGEKYYDEDDEVRADLQVVDREAKTVASMVRPFVQEEKEYGPQSETSTITVNHDAIERDSVAPVLMHKLRKVYPGTNGNPPKVALHSLSMHVPRGQVLGLLGENGAGKTTALKILSGAHEKSGGLGLVAGYDSDVETIQVSERFGSCAQFDIVWNDRSVQEHLEFFAKLKGLRECDVKEASRNIALAVGLGEEDVYTRDAGDLSGGMKRRLSIAMSLVGAPEVLDFDEPTTGLDPSTRNSIWGLFSSFATPERSMVITTHMMLEADTLCTRIAIVAEGRLKVIGSQRELKHTLGDGFALQATLIGGTQEDEDRALKFAKDRLHPDATLRARRAKTLFIDIPRDLNLPTVFRSLCSRDCAELGGINHFTLSECPLEAVFHVFGERD